MKSINAIWFECKIRYEKMQEDGSQKNVTELYVVDALSFSEAEERITEEMSSYISGSFEVNDIRKASYGEVFFSEDSVADRWYKTKLEYIIIDEKSGKEKRSGVNYLVHAATLQGAVKNIEEAMGGSMQDYVIASIAETKIMDVFQYRKKESDDKPEYEE